MLQEEEAAATASAPDSSQEGRIAGPVRVVARICPAAAPQGAGRSFQVSASAACPADAPAVVSLLPLHDHPTPRPSKGERKDYDYRLDGFYPKDDDTCQHIFQREVKPLLDAAFLRGTNACVVACGANDKTNLIASLLNMAVEQILLLSKPIAASISVSSYQVLQDNHVFDLLEPKDSEVLVLEDAGARTNLKGLSRFDVKSIEELGDLCSCGTNKLKQHTTKSQPRGRGHLGFIIYISRFDQQGKECAVAKMNFLDLAAYVDPKHKNNAGGLNCNKSMYALMNVVQALNSNQTFIPYRQSKLTRILQDSLCKTSRAVLVACLDEFSSQDIVSTLSLTSRSSQVVNEQCYSLSLGARSSSKSSVNLCASAKNLSRSLLPSIHQQGSVLDKHRWPQFSNSTVKASRTPAANKRSILTMHSAKKPLSSLSTSMKQRGVQPALGGRKLFGPGTDLSKEDKIVAAPTEMRKAEELQSSLGMEIQGTLRAEGCDKTEKIIEVIPGIMQYMVSSSMQEVDFPSSDLHADHSCTNLGITCSPDITDDLVEKTSAVATQSSPKLTDQPKDISNLSDIADDFVEKTPADATQSSPKLTDQLKEISNSLKLLSSQPMSVMKQKSHMAHAQDFNTNLPEPKTPAIHLKFEHPEDSHELLKARSTGIQKSVAWECLAFLNSANKEQLKSLKGIGEKRANFILELREESPELFKEIDDLKTIIGMNKKEIKNLMSGMLLDS